MEWMPLRSPFYTLPYLKTGIRANGLARPPGIEPAAGGLEIQREKIFQRHERSFKASAHFCMFFSIMVTAMLAVLLQSFV
jgi:hypothetical protein